MDNLELYLQWKQEVASDETYLGFHEWRAERESILCDCNRWHGAEHDLACPLAGEPKAQ